MKTTQGISLYCYLYLKLAKTPCFSYYLLWFFFYKSENKRAGQVLPGGAGQNLHLHLHVSKCKNDKIKFKKRKGRKEEKKNPKT
jgi:hypothetical protein